MANGIASPKSWCLRKRQPAAFTRLIIEMRKMTSFGRPLSPACFHIMREAYDPRPAHTTTINRGMPSQPKTTRHLWRVKNGTMRLHCVEENMRKYLLRDLSVPATMASNRPEASAIISSNRRPRSNGISLKNHIAPSLDK